MLNPESTHKVIAALRSGNTRQTRGRLEDRDGSQCCLGVACRAAIADGVEVTVSGREWIEFDGMEDVLPDQVRGWLGVEDADPELLVPAKVRAEHPELAELPLPVAATSLNDDYGLTFLEIADCFEATLEAERDARGEW